MARDIKILLKEQRREINKDFKEHIDVLVERFDDKVDLIAEQHGSIIKTLASHTEMIGTIKENVEMTKIDVSFIKGALKQKVDVDEFSALEKRVILLEKRVSKISHA